MQGLRVIGEEVPDSPPLLLVGDWIGLEGMDHIRELHSISDEEDGEIESHQIVVSLLSVARLIVRIRDNEIQYLQFDGKSSGISDILGGSSGGNHSGESENERTESKNKNLNSLS